MISTQELSDSLKVTPQRIGVLTKTCNITDDESIIKGRTRLYSRNAVKKLFSYRGVNYNSKNIIAISNNKGGVGKTSIATSIAKRLTSLGFDVLLIDIDPQANSTGFLFNTEELQSKINYVLHDVITKKCNINEAIVEIESGLRILPSSLLNSRLESELSGTQKNPATFLKSILCDTKDNFIIFDMSPSFSQINFLCSLAANLVIIPTLLTRFSIEGVQMTLESIREWNQEYENYSPDVRILINQLDSRLSSQLGYAGALKDAIGFNDSSLKADLFSTVIRADNTINRVQSGQSELSNSSNFYKDIAQLTEEIIGLSNLLIEANQ
jgi:chromosome partitioning protein